MNIEEQSPNWTTVDRYFHPTEAHIAAGKLEAEGIPVFLLGINHASANWLLSNALGGIRLQVPEDFVEDAKQLLAEIVAIDEDREICPRCGSADSSPMNNSRKIAFLAVHLFSIPLPWQSKRRHCDSCGAEWISE
ncbi:MAG: DUF2007 domain-containing protein [Woeseiaceae bacterium]|nr:DUF2007 domain-containing protein [Woeseiaceae bacterium]